MRHRHAQAIAQFERRAHDGVELEWAAGFEVLQHRSFVLADFFRPGDALLFGPETCGLPAAVIEAIALERRLRELAVLAIAAMKK